VSTLAEAYQLTGDENYREVMEDSLAFVERELAHPDGGFYSSLDADSEGEEGKFYVWDKKEVDGVLGEDSALFCEFYDVTDEGNWAEHPGKPRTNILRVREPLEAFAGRKGMDTDRVAALLAAARSKLMAHRSLRVRPGLDDKIILGWNALMNTACSQAYAATGNQLYRELASANMDFLLTRFNTGEGNQLRHTWKNNEAKYPAFLDDYAYIIEALIFLQETTMETRWIDVASGLVQFVLEEFREEGGDLFYYTGKSQSDVLLRKKEIYDGAVPSGNAVMASNLYKLGLLTGHTEWKDQAFRMIGTMGALVIKYPGSFGVWSTVLLEMVSGTSEIAVVGPGAGKLNQEILGVYLPHRVLMATEREREDFPLLAGKKAGEYGEIFLCKDFACLQPVMTTEALRTLINSAKMVD
ncbi:MAG: thioredoxin domain-containing protein, partial [Chitinophagaceae bacterium]